MRVMVECHGPLADLCGGLEQAVEGLMPGADVAEVLAALAARVPDIAETLRYTAVARGDVLVSRAEPVWDGDRLALIPPVSGG